MEKNEPRKEWQYDGDVCPPEAKIALEGLVDMLIKEADERAFEIMHKIARKATGEVVKVV